jgi:colanic acid/amylovoran biosynthesis glycosyltransferase
MKLCYIVNQYPKVSHSFIRREIIELERQGATVLRVALRGWDQPLVDPLDVTERDTTRYILRNGLPRMLSGLLSQLFGNLPRLLGALRIALAMSRESDKPLLKHLVCLAEGCVAATWIQEAAVMHIHAHFGTNSAEVALLASHLAGVPFSFTVHGPEEFDHPVGLGLGVKAAHAAAVVAISSYGRSQLYRWMAAEDWKKVRVVHCGLDESFLRAAPPPTAVSDHAFVCVGRLCEQKGQLLLLDALRQVLDRGHHCRVVLAGDGEMRSAIEARIRTLGLEGQVRITGWIDSARVREEILAARALLLPSFAEGLPVVLMEAMAMARPVITTYVAGIPELVEDGRNGWLVPAGDVDGLANAMMACLACDDAGLQRMGHDGRQRVLERHDIATEGAKLRQIFQAAHSA